MHAEKRSMIGGKRKLKQFHKLNRTLKMVVVGQF